MAQIRPPGAQIVFDPRGTVLAEAVPVAPRIQELGGARLAVLDNTKWNANKLLRGSMEKLRERLGIAEINYYRKESFSKVAAPELLAEIANNNDIVLTAIGD